MTHDLCTVKDCWNHGKYSRRCGHFHIEAEDPKTIAPYSKKREQINRKQYGPEVKKFLSEHPICDIGMEGCTKKATCVHHVKGRSSIKDLLNKEFWKASCINCNNAVERLDAQARSEGNKISKHEPNYKRVIE